MCYTETPIKMRRQWCYSRDFRSRFKYWDKQNSMSICIRNRIRRRLNDYVIDSESEDFGVRTRLYRRRGGGLHENGRHSPSIAVVCPRFGTDSMTIMYEVVWIRERW